MAAVSESARGQGELGRLFDGSLPFAPVSEAGPAQPALPSWVEGGPSGGGGAGRLVLRDTLPATLLGGAAPGLDSSGPGGRCGCAGKSGGCSGKAGGCSGKSGGCSGCARKGTPTRPKDHAPEFLRMVEDARPRVTEIDAAELSGRLRGPNPPVLIDVREKDEWNAGHLPGAVSIPRGVLERDVCELVPDKDRGVVLYCQGGFRSVLAAEALQRMGYRDVLSLEGGVRALSSRAGIGGVPAPWPLWPPLPVPITPYPMPLPFPPFPLPDPFNCALKCSGKDCGPVGKCNCGTCPEGKFCVDGKCVCDTWNCKPPCPNYCKAGGKGQNSIYDQGTTWGCHPVKKRCICRIETPDGKGDDCAAGCVCPGGHVCQTYCLTSTLQKPGFVDKKACNKDQYEGLLASIATYNKDYPNNFTTIAMEGQCEPAYPKPGVDPDSA